MIRLVFGVLTFLAGVTNSVLADDRAGNEESPSTWLVIYSPGPSWTQGKPVGEQGLEGHFHWLLDLYANGTMKLAGPFTDDSGGMVVLEAADSATAHGLLAGDPAIEHGIMQYELRPLRLHPWDAYLEARERRRQQSGNDTSR